MTTAPGQPRALFADESDGLGRILTAPPDRFHEAVNRLVGGPDASPEAGRHFLAVASETGVDLRRLWIRISNDDEVVASVLCVPNAGRASMVFASQATSEFEQALLSPVINRACEDLLNEPLCIAQALIDPGDRTMEHAFAAAGFHTLAFLSYMERPLSGRRVPPAPKWSDDAALVSYEPNRDGDLLMILKESYQGTLDCPGLRGMRTTEDILAGHKATGQMEPNLWTMLYLGDRPSGVLLLNPTPASNVVELVYLGLAPHARGRGLGRQLLHHGFRLLAGRAERAIALAVDDANAPAIALYRREGFRRTLRRHAMLRALHLPTGT